MTNETQFKKEVQNRKRDYQDKKVELISRLCAEANTEDKDHKKDKK